MDRLLLVGMGGCIGSIARFLLTNGVQRAFATSVPLGTFVVNVLGCFVIGLVAELAGRPVGWSQEHRALLFTGVLGGFTTFSAFGQEAFLLTRDQGHSLAAMYVISQVVLGLAAVWCGHGLASWWGS